MVAVYAINACIIFPGIVTVVYHIDDLVSIMYKSTTRPIIAIE